MGLELYVLTRCPGCNKEHSVLRGLVTVEAHLCDGCKLKWQQRK